MPSTYNPLHKCRVGTMDEAQFRAECDPRSALFFAALIEAWTAAGGTLRWGAGGVGLRGTVDGKELAVCFLAPQFAGKRDRIELACASLAKQMNAGRLEALRNALRQSAAEHLLGTSMLSVVDPGALPPADQRALIDAFLDLI